MPLGSASSNDTPRQRRVLCVDDEPAIRSVLEILLTRAHYEVETAVDGREAWQKISSNLDKYDVVVTDGQMPNLDGVAFVRLLRRANFGGRIVVFSSRPTPETLNQLQNIGVDAIVEKGSGIDELLKAIAGDP